MKVDVLTSGGSAPRLGHDLEQHGRLYPHLTAEGAAVRQDERHRDRDSGREDPQDDAVPCRVPAMDHRDGDHGEACLKEEDGPFHPVE